MINSVRRIALSLFIFSVVTFGSTVLINSLSLCNGVGQCTAAALFSYDFDSVAAQSTAQTTTPGEFIFYTQAGQLIALYILIPSFLTLALLEIWKPYFLKKANRKKFVW